MATDPALERAPASGWRWGICGLLLLATMVNYMDRLTVNFMAPEIMEELALDERQYGYLESAFAYAFALGAIVFGWLVDRWSVRWIYPLAVLAWSAAGFATGLANGFLALLTCRFLLGLAEAGNWPSALRTTQHVLPPAERSLGNSILQSGTSIGSILTPFVIMALAKLGGWRPPFFVIGAIGLFWVVAWLAYLRGKDLTMEQRPTRAPVRILSFLVVLAALDVGVHVWAAGHPWLPLATKAAVIGLSIATVFAWLMHTTRDDTRLPRAVFFRRFCVLGMVVVTINTTWHILRAWLALFLRKAHGYDQWEFLWFSAAYYLFTDIGCLTAGFVTLVLIRRRLSVHRSRLMVFGACALMTMLTPVVGLLPAGAGGFWLLALLFLIGFAALGLFPNYYSFSQEITVQYQGKVTGALGCTCWLSMSLIQELVGDAVKRTDSYALPMTIAGLAPLLGFVALLCFWGTAEPRAESPRPPPAPALNDSAGELEPAVEKV